MKDGRGPRAMTLDDSVQYLPRVGPFRAKEFQTLGVRTVEDLLEHVPFRHDHRPKSVPIGNLKETGVTATLIGQLTRVRGGSDVQGRHVLKAVLVDGTGRCHVRWFNSPFLQDRLGEGTVVKVSGKIEETGGWAGMTNPHTIIIPPGTPPLKDDEEVYVPVYSATAHLPSSAIAAIIRDTLGQALPRVEEFLPEPIREARNFPTRRTALARIHEPTSPADVEVARRRLAYDEFLLMRVAMRLRHRWGKTRFRAPSITLTPLIDERIRKRFPFALTEGQNKALEEICRDLRGPEPMNRLLQADVGAGKTAVALYAALVTIANRLQVAFLAPTEVLARQHYDKARHYLDASRVRLAYLAGSTSRARRRELLEGLGSGQVDLLIGTHALLEEDVRIQALGLVVIDEQHKFGVAQRARLRGKGAAPHTLILTATPIPRTLAMTFFADFDVSVIRQRPFGHRAVSTHMYHSTRTEDVWPAVRARLDAGERVYIVYPLVDESDHLPLQSVLGEAQRLARGPLTGYALETLHGQMSARDKNAIMARFKSGQTQVLASTTVIEVGVDVPEATVMVIQHADRFGLSQLHQLRGRIGRGNRPGACYLLTDVENPATLERLKALCRTDDGFRIAEEDLRLRGPGELLGKRQHGMPVLKVADLVKDVELLEWARDDAAALLTGDPNLSHPAHGALKRAVWRKYGEAFPLVDVA